MIAEEETISELLGYAENAAHTGWVARAEKLKAHYIKAGAIITPIRHCITQLFNLISETEGDRDQKALIDYFKAKEPIDKKEQNTKKKKTKAEVVVIPSKPEEFSTVLISTGFKVASEKGFKESSLPRELIVEVAYDNGKKSRFKKYSPHDFQLGEGTIKIDQSGLKEISRSPNKLTYDILSLPFKLAVIGFDENRDLKIKSFLGDIC